MTPVTDVIAVREYGVGYGVLLVRGEIMSTLYHTHEKADLKYTDYTDYTDRTDYGFILALFCMVLVILVGIAIFRPAPVGAGIIASEITSVGP